MNQPPFSQHSGTVNAASNSTRPRALAGTNYHQQLLAQYHPQLQTNDYSINLQLNPPIHMMPGNPDERLLKWRPSYNPPGALTQGLASGGTGTQQNIYPQSGQMQGVQYQPPTQPGPLRNRPLVYRNMGESNFQKRSVDTEVDTGSPQGDKGKKRARSLGPEADKGKKRARSPGPEGNSVGGGTHHLPPNIQYILDPFDQQPDVPTVESRNEEYHYIRCAWPCNRGSYKAYFPNGCQKFLWVPKNLTDQSQCAIALSAIERHLRKCKLHTLTGIQIGRGAAIDKGRNQVVLCQWGGVSSPCYEHEGVGLREGVVMAQMDKHVMTVHMQGTTFSENAGLSRNNLLGQDSASTARPRPRSRGSRKKRKNSHELADVDVDNVDGRSEAQKAPIASGISDGVVPEGPILSLDPPSAEVTAAHFVPPSSLATSTEHYPQIPSQIDLDSFDWSEFITYMPEDEVDITKPMSAAMTLPNSQY